MKNTESSDAKRYRRMIRAYPVGMLNTVHEKCMGNVEGAVALVIGHCVIGRLAGVILLFENGKAMAMDENELADNDVVPFRVIHSCRNYRFTNYRELNIDFQDGRFKAAFE